MWEEVQSWVFLHTLISEALPLTKPVNTSRLLTFTGAKMSLIFAKIRDEEKDQLTGTKFRWVSVHFLVKLCILMSKITNLGQVFLRKMTDVLE